MTTYHCTRPETCPTCRASREFGRIHHAWKLEIEHERWRCMRCGQYRPIVMQPGNHGGHTPTHLHWSKDTCCTCGEPAMRHVGMNGAPPELAPHGDP